MTDIEIIQRQLDRVLAFFPRVEARINGLFGVNTLIMAVCALNVTAEDLKLWYVSVPGALFVAAICTSYTYLFKANFPDVRGGAGSLIYFGEIRKRTEVGYRDEVVACSDEKYRDDLIGQTWRNADILCSKYEGVKKAIIATTISLVPFSIFLAATATIHGRVPFFKG